MTIARHTATGPNGETFTRGSKTRRYSHVVIGRLSHDHAVAAAKSPLSQDNDRENFAHWSGLADGSSRFLVRGSWERDDVLYAERVAREMREAVDRLNGATTAEAYAADRLRQRLAAVEARKAAGEYDLFRDLSWASRRDLADKAAGSARNGTLYADVRVVPAFIA